MFPSRAPGSQETQRAKPVLAAMGPADVGAAMGGQWADDQGQEDTGMVTAHVTQVQAGLQGSPGYLLQGEL